MRKFILFVVFSIVSVSLFGFLFYYFSNNISETNYPISRQVKYNFTLQNKTNDLIKNAEFRAYAPVKMTSNQLCKELIVSHPYDLQVDSFGNQILIFKFDIFPPYSSKIINIKANMFFATNPNQISEKNIQQFLEPQKLIESDSHEIISMAKTLRKNKIDTTAENISNWVTGHIQYSGYISRSRGALYALKNKKGDCTEYMSLFTALCRANEIPARGVGGYISAESTILKPSKYHNWSEFYHDGTWQIADTQNNKIMQDQSNYIAMKIFDAKSENQTNSFNRFSTGNSGLKANMN